uniref:Uncharacterized protein n=1 Tax=Tetranychus urticae TaxID=32264 RepID=T1JTK3_TETUR
MVLQQVTKIQSDLIKQSEIIG